MNTRWKYSEKFPSRTDWPDSGSVLPPKSVTFYTDGSLLNDRAGAGVYSESQNTGDAYSLDAQATVNVITGNCCSNSQLHKMGLTEADSAFHFLCVCPTLAILLKCIMGKPKINAF
jgi:hypothetical protein